MQIYSSPIKNLLFEGNPHFYLDFHPQCLALGFQSMFESNREGICRWFEMFFPSSTKPNLYKSKVLPDPGFQFYGDFQLSMKDFVL